MIGRKVLEKALDWADEHSPPDGTPYGDVIYEIVRGSFIAGFEEAFAILREIVNEYENG